MSKMFDNVKSASCRVLDLWICKTVPRSIDKSWRSLSIKACTKCYYSINYDNYL